MKSLILTTATVAALALAATAGSVVSPAATLTIRHQAVGCHSWSLNGGAYRVEQTVRLRLGQSLRVVNRDSHAHTLVKLSGGSLAYAPEPQFRRRSPASPAMPLPPEPSGPVAAPSGVGVMGYSGAGVTVTFHDVGNYLLTTKAGAAFAGGNLTSTGPDNTLIARVLVFAPVHYRFELQ